MDYQEKVAFLRQYRDSLRLERDAPTLFDLMEDVV